DLTFGPGKGLRNRGRFATASPSATMDHCRTAYILEEGPSMTASVDQLLTRVSKPARYTGGEWNSITRDWDSHPVRFVLCYPDAYDVGMSNMGIGILYDLLNKQEDVLCERAFAPWEDMEAEMRREGVLLWSLENRRPLREFDVIGFTL